MERRLAAILAVDVVGYSRLVGKNEEAAIRRWNACRTTIDRLVTEHQGRIFGGAGDSVIAEFASPVEAVRCAVKIQQKVGASNADMSEDQRMLLRIGVNLGDVIVVGANLLGDGVNIAARLEGLAEPGGICVAGTVFEHVKGKVGLSFTDLGLRQIKNISEPLRVYSAVPAARHDAAAAGAPPLKRTPSVVVGPANQESGAALLGIDLSLPDKPSIAVLPFVNMSTDPEQEYFSDGITEDIITALSKISSLLVVARNSTFTYKGRAVDVKQVGREQGVRYVLEGSVRKAGKRVRVTAQLVDASTGHHLWAERYDRDLEDIFAVQDEITREVVIALDVHLREGEQARFWSGGTKNLEAWECIRLGSELANRLTPETRLEARNLFQKALDLDPNYAFAWVALGWTYFHEADVGIGYRTKEDREAALESAVECAQRALELDSSCVDAYAQLGMCHLSKGEHDQAIDMSERAVAMAPNHAEKLAIAAAILNKSGHPHRSIELVRKAMRLCPIYPPWYLYVLGTAFRVAGQTDSAVSVFREAIKRNPDYFALYVGLASALGELGREKDAKDSVSNILRLDPDFSINRYVKGLFYRAPSDLARFEDGLRKVGLPE